MVNTESIAICDILQDRRSGSKFWDFGPNDLCILTMRMDQKGLKKLFNKPKVISKVHNIYGVNTSSLASIALYFKQISDKFLNSSKCKLISGCFCIYDIFSQCDICVEIEIPGTAKAYLITEVNEKKAVTESDWEGAYLSSVLRFLNPIDPKATFTDHFTTFELLEFFFELTLRHKRKYDLISIDSSDKDQYFINSIFNSFNKYLISRKLYKTLQELYTKHMEKDPALINFFCQSNLKIDGLDQVISLILYQIKVNPHIFHFYYSAARAYYKKGDFSEALQLCQYIIELDSEEFDYWELLIKCNLELKNFKAALICFNFIPIPKKFPKRLKNEKLSRTDKSNRNFYIINKTPDFINSQDSPNTLTEKEKKELEKLRSLPGDKYHTATKRAYNLLVDLEVHITLSSISTLRDSVLKLSNPINDFQNRENSGKIEYNIEDSNINDRNKLSLLFDPRLHFQQSIFTDLFNSLKMDLNCFFHVRKIFLAVDKFSENFKDNTSGVLWIFRGKLAERVKKFSVALNCYRLAVDKGFSLFAWYRIIKLSYKVGNPSLTVCGIKRVFDYALQMGAGFDVVPPWVEKVLGKLCAECGFRQVNSLIHEVFSHHKSISSTLTKLNSLEKYKN